MAKKKEAKEVPKFTVGEKVIFVKYGERYNAVIKQITQRDEYWAERYHYFVEFQEKSWGKMKTRQEWTLPAFLEKILNN